MLIFIIFHSHIYRISHLADRMGRLVFLAISAAALDYRLIEQGLSFKNGMRGTNSILAAGLDLCKSRLPLRSRAVHVKDLE